MKKLALPITLYERTFRQVAGHIGHFIGKLDIVKVQLHDDLELVMCGIKVMTAADYKLQFGFGTDLFTPVGTKLQEVLVQTKGV